MFEKISTYKKTLIATGVAAAAVGILAYRGNLSPVAQATASKVSALKPYIAQFLKGAKGAAVSLERRARPFMATMSKVTGLSTKVLTGAFAAVTATTALALSIIGYRLFKSKGLTETLDSLERDISNFEKQENPDPQAVYKVGAALVALRGYHTFVKNRSDIVENNNPRIVRDMKRLDDISLREVGRELIGEYKRSRILKGMLPLNEEGLENLEEKIKDLRERFEVVEATVVLGAVEESLDETLVLLSERISLMETQTKQDVILINNTKELIEALDCFCRKAHEKSGLIIGIKLPIARDIKTCDSRMLKIRRSTISVLRGRLDALQKKGC